MEFSPKIVRECRFSTPSPGPGLTSPAAFCKQAAGRFFRLLACYTVAMRKLPPIAIAALCVGIALFALVALAVVLLVLEMAQFGPPL